MTTKTTHFKSRWGFHPCDFTWFLKLKHLHKLYWQTVYDFHRWHRWWRKDEHNRRVPEPVYCPVFVENKPWFKPVKFHGDDGFKVYPKTVLDHGIVELYRTARVPQSELVPPFDADVLSRIEKRTVQVREFER